MRTSNPALKPDVFNSGYYSQSSQDVMTVDGAISKSAILLAILLASAGWVWSLAFQSQTIGQGGGMAANIQQLATFTTVGGIGGLILAIIILFKKTWAPVLAPVYAGAEGLVIGGASALLEMQYPGIAIQAAFLTFSTLGVLVFGYKAGLIKVTEKFRSIIVMGTGAIFLLYLASFIMSFFGVPFSFLHDSSPLSIGISLLICFFAAMNLILDFELIESGARRRAPKYFEWFSAFALLVTLVWLYLEFLNLLRKLRDEN